MMDTLWKCEQWRAGRVHSKMLFNTRNEAEQFIAHMRRAEPDLLWRMEPVAAKRVWN